MEEYVRWCVGGGMCGCVWVGGGGIPVVTTQQL